MIIWILIVAVIIGLLAGGRIGNLARLDFKYVYFIFAAYLIQVGIDFWAAAHIFWGYPYLHIISYLLLFAGLLINRRLPGMYLFMAGTLLNFIVIAVNGGYMPVRTGIVPEYLATMLATGHGGTHALITDTTKLKFLADVIYFPDLRYLISFGDIVIDLGLMVLVIFGMKGKSETELKIQA